MTIEIKAIIWVPKRMKGVLKTSAALAGVAQWIEHQPVNQRVAGLNPSQGTCLGCGPEAPVKGAQEATT